MATVASARIAVRLLQWTIAARTVTSATARLLSEADEEDDQDPFMEHEEDEEELSENEIVIEDC